MVIDEVNLSQKFLFAKPLQSLRAFHFWDAAIDTSEVCADFRGLENAVYNWPRNRTRLPIPEMVAKPGCRWRRNHSAVRCGRSHGRIMRARDRVSERGMVGRIDLT